MLACKMRQLKIRAGPDVSEKKAGKEWEQEQTWPGEDGKGFGDRECVTGKGHRAM